MRGLGHRLVLVGDPCLFLDVSTLNPFYNHAFGDHFVCDTNEL
jgi:hypothetical protein